MHHGKAGRQLGRNTAHRKAMFRNMVDSLMGFERIETTLPKAKELRKYADRVITLGKKGTLHSRRRALTYMRTQENLRKVFGPLAERYRNRAGGYTRILKLGPRKSDSTPMALIELVDAELPSKDEGKTQGKKAKSPKESPPKNDSGKKAKTPQESKKEPAAKKEAKAQSKPKKEKELNKASKKDKKASQKTKKDKEKK